MIFQDILFWYLFCFYPIVKYYKMGSIYLFIQLSLQYSCIYSFIHSFIKCLLSTYYVSDIVSCYDNEKDGPRLYIP